MVCASPVVLAAELRFPEGPAFAPDGALWFVELQGKCLARIEADGSITRHVVGGAPNGLAFDGQGVAWFCDAEERSIRELDPITGRTETLVSSGAGKTLDKPNDLAFDPMGTLVFTCPGESRTEPTVTVWALRRGETVPVARDLYFTNRLAFLDGGTVLVVAETYRHRLWRGQWDVSEAKWHAPTPWAEVGGPVGPDGMALGADGLLYVAVFGQGCVKAINAAGGVVATYRTPGARPTNCAFDPAGHLGPVITEAERGELLAIPALGPGAALFRPTRVAASPAPAES